MKTNNKFLRVSTILIACCFTTIGFSKTDEEKKEQEKQEVRVNYMNYLHEQGYKPEVDEDDDVKFMYEGRTYYLLVNTKRVFTVMRLLSHKDACNERVSKTLIKTHKDFYNVTILPTSSCNGIIFSSRSFVNDPDDWKGIFQISLNSVKNSIETSQDYHFGEA